MISSQSQLASSDAELIWLTSYFRVFEAGWLYDSFPFLYTVLCNTARSFELHWLGSRGLIRQCCIVWSSSSHSQLLIALFLFSGRLVVYIYVCVCCMHLCARACMCVCEFICVCVHACLYVCMHVYTVYTSVRKSQYIRMNDVT